MIDFKGYKYVIIKRNGFHIRYTHSDVEVMEGGYLLETYLYQKDNYDLHANPDYKERVLKANVKIPDYKTSKYDGEFLAKTNESNEMKSDRLADEIMEKGKEAVYTQEMFDAGEAPKIGMIAELTNSPEIDAEKLMIGDLCIVDSWRNGDELTVIATVYMFNAKTIVVQNKRTCQVSTITKDYYKPIDQRTDSEKAIDDMAEQLTNEGIVGYDKIMLNILVAKFKAGKIHGVTFTGDKK